MSTSGRSRRVKRRKPKKPLTNSEIADRYLGSFELYHQKGDIGQSFYSLSSALTTLPSLREIYCSSFLEVFESWSSTVEEDYGFQEAVKLFEVAPKHYPDSPDIKYLLAKILYRHGNTYEAWSYACLAHSECTEDPNAQETRGRLANALVDRWHIPMLNDIKRNESFKNAIAEAIKEGHEDVLDIGAGTGLLSIFAKQAGAKKVYGCEVDKFMYEIANGVLKSNSITKDIQFYNIHSQKLRLPTHLPKRVSLVVTETVDAGLLGEHILTTLQHAWSHLLLPPPPNIKVEISRDKTTSDNLNSQKFGNVSSGVYEDSKQNAGQDICQEEPVKYGRVIPSSAEVFVALISCRYIAHCTKLHNPDLLKYFKGKMVILKLDEPYMSENLNNVPGGYQLLSEWTPVSKIDFNSPSNIKAHLNGLIKGSLELKSTQEGTVDALAVAFNLHVNDSNCISTLPSSCSPAWENAIYPVHLEKSLSVNDTVIIDYTFRGGILNLALQPEANIELPGKNFFLSASAMSFLTRKEFMDSFLRAAKETALKVKNHTKKKPDSTFIICDITPFPVAGLSVLPLFSNVVLYVEEERILKSLREIGVTAKLTEDLEEEVDILFLWPITKEGCLQDELVKKILMYRLMMAKEGLVFPQKIDLILDAVESPFVTTLTKVDDANTCGVKVADVFNIVKTNHHMDIHLDTLQHTSVLSQPMSVLQLSLTSGNVDSLGINVEQKDDEDLLILGGDIVTVHASATAIKSSVIHALPYWFIVSADLESPFTHSTRDQNSPCKQSMFVLDHPVQVENGVSFYTKIIWRDGVFSAGYIDE